MEGTLPPEPTVIDYNPRTNAIMTASLQFKVAAVALAVAVSGTPERAPLPPPPPTQAELAQMRAARNEHWEKLEADLERLIDALGQDFNVFGEWARLNGPDAVGRRVARGILSCLSKTYFVRLGDSGRWYITCDGCLAVPVDRGYGPSHQAFVDYLDALPPGITESRLSDQFAVSKAFCAEIRRSSSPLRNP